MPSFMPCRNTSPSVSAWRSTATFIGLPCEARYSPYILPSDSYVGCQPIVHGLPSGSLENSASPACTNTCGTLRWLAGFMIARFGRRAEGLEEREDVLVDQLAEVLRRLGRVVAVVVVGELDLARLAVAHLHAALGVDGLEDGLGAARRGLPVWTQRARQRVGPAERDLRCRSRRAPSRSRRRLRSPRARSPPAA